MLRCILCLIVPLVCLSSASAQSEEREALATVEIGAAPSWNLPGFSPSLSPTTAVEFTPIERWLEIEIGTTPSFGGGQTTWVTDFLFKKPWTLTRNVEFMAGIGPEWIHVRGGGSASSSIGLEGALDFMFWPNPSKRWGWYIEPTLDHNFGRGYSSSLGLSCGLLIKLP
jgi:hypothetical protein